MLFDAGKAFKHTGAVEFDVQQHDVYRIDCSTQGFFTRRCLGDASQRHRHADDHVQAGAEHGVVVDQQDILRSRLTSKPSTARF